MSRRQMVFLLGVNAFVSLLISLCVVLAFRWYDRRGVPVSPTLVAQPRFTPTVLPGTTTAPLPTPTPGPTVYVVQPGDTLSAIALMFDISEQDLMRANNLVDPDTIYVGQELFIPIGGLPTDTPLPPPSPVEPSTPSPMSSPEEATPTPAPTPVAQPQVTISEVLYRGDPAQETVVLFNPGRPVVLRDWTLRDAQGHVYTFPNFFLGTGGSVRIHTGSGTDTPTDLYWGLDEAVWGEPGDVVTLADNNGLIITTYPLP